MSFILDALKKSDQQRQLGAVPTLTSARIAAEQPAQPKHMFYVLIAVFLLIAGLLIGWLQPWSDNRTARSEPPLPVVKQEGAPPLKNTGDGSGTRESASLNASEIAPKGSRAATMPAAVTSDTVKRVDAVAHKDAMTVTQLPTTIQREIPKMSISVHVFSSEPAKRFATINDQLLHEGDFMTPLLKLEQITAEGMVFSYKGFHFLVRVH